MKLNRRSALCIALFAGSLAALTIYIYVGNSARGNTASASEHIEVVKAAADIARFLPAYFKYEAHLMRRGCRLVAIDSMGDGLYKIETEEGQLIEHQGSLLQTAAFEQILGTDF